MNGYNFTEPVRRALACARAEAHALGSTHVAPEHVLLGLLREPTSVAGVTLARRGVDAATLSAQVRAVLECATVPAGAPMDLPYAGTAKRALERAMGVARDLGEKDVGSVHLLIGVAADERSIVGKALLGAGLSVATLREEYVHIRPEHPLETVPAAPAQATGRAEIWRAKTLVGLGAIVVAVLTLVVLWAGAA